MKATAVEFPKLWLIQGPTDGYGCGVAFVDEDEARREAECWGGEEVHGPFLPVDAPPLDGMLLDAVRLVAKLPQKMPYTDDEKRRLKLAVKACRAYLRTTAAKPGE